MKRGWFSYAYRQSNPPWVTGAAGTQVFRMVVEGIVGPGDTVLDVGCGYGIEAVFLSVQGMKVVGLDCVPEALMTGKALARVYHASVIWVQGDVLALSCRAEAFDVINDQGCFHHILPERRQRYAEQVARVLRSGGVFMLSGFSDRIEPRLGPHRLSSRDILETFLPFLECEELFRFRNLPLESGEPQWHWWSLWRKPEAQLR